jgi:hypothetical protein
MQPEWGKKLKNLYLSVPLNFEIHFGPTLLSNENHQKSNKNNLSSRV